jgi:hypothetical protein
MDCFLKKTQSEQNISKWLSKPKDSGGPHYTTSRSKRPPEAHTENSSPHKDYTGRKATHILSEKNQRRQSPLAVHRNAYLTNTKPSALDIP